MAGAHASVHRGRAPVVIHQRDTFYRVARGRLKLRVPDSGTAELIAYEDLGLCERGEAGQFIESGATRPAILSVVPA